MCTEASATTAAATTAAACLWPAWGAGHATQHAGCERAAAAAASSVLWILLCSWTCPLAGVRLAWSQIAARCLQPNEGRPCFEMLLPVGRRSMNWVRVHEHSPYEAAFDGCATGSPGAVAPFPVRSELSSHATPSCVAGCAAAF